MKKHSILYYLYPFLVVCIPWIYLAVIWNELPATIPTHFGLSGQPDHYGPKSDIFTGPAIISVMSILLYFLLMNIYRLDPKKYSAATAAVLQKIAHIMPLFFSLLGLLVLYWTVKKKTDGMNLLMTAVGLLLAYVGNLMHSIKPNYFAGFRLPWTLENEENWRKTHQLASKIWFAGGIFLALISLLLPILALMIVFFCCIFVMVLIPAVYSYRLYRDSKKSI